MVWGEFKERGVGWQVFLHEWGSVGTIPFSEEENNTVQAVILGYFPPCEGQTGSKGK